MYNIIIYLNHQDLCLVTLWYGGLSRTVRVLDHEFALGFLPNLLSRRHHTRPRTTPCHHRPPVGLSKTTRLLDHATAFFTHSLPESHLPRRAHIDRLMSALPKTCTTIWPVVFPSQEPAPVCPLPFLGLWYDTWTVDITGKVLILSAGARVLHRKLPADPGTPSINASLRPPNRRW